MTQTFITMIGIAIALIAGAFIYQRMHEPRSAADRIDAATEELKKGNLGNASDTLNDRTPADQLERTLDNLVQPK